MDIIEEQLVVHRDAWSRFKYMMEEENRRRRQPDFVHPFPRIFKVVDTIKFEMAIGFVMCMNAVTMAVSADTQKPPMWVDIMEHVFTSIFVGEAYLRVGFLFFLRQLPC